MMTLVSDCLMLVWLGFAMDLTRSGVHLISEHKIILKVNRLRWNCYFLSAVIKLCSKLHYSMAD